MGTLGKRSSRSTRFLATAALALLAGAGLACPVSAGDVPGTPTPTKTPCQGGTCGDGAVQGDEQCDDGNAFGGDGCARNCTITRVDGAPTSCGALAPRFLGSKLAAALAALHKPIDLVATFVLSPAAPVCAGDCQGNGQVTVDELLTLVSIALGNASTSACDIGDANDNGQITVDKLVAAVTFALEGCE